MTRTKVPINRHKDMYDYYQEGHSLQEVGEMWGVSRERVRQIFEKHNLPRRGRGGKENPISERGRKNMQQGQRLRRRREEAKKISGKPKKYPWVLNMGILHYTMNTLEQLQEQVLEQKWWKEKISMEDKLKYIDKLARARNEFWGVVYRTYPELSDKSLISVGGSREIVINEE